MKAQRTVWVATLGLAAYAWGATASADSFRCANGLVGNGDSKAAVLGKCGEPAMRDSFCKAAPPAITRDGANPDLSVTVQPCVNVDLWTFNPGKGRFLTTLTFEDGVLTAIEQGARIRE